MTRLDYAQALLSVAKCECGIFRFEDGALSWQSKVLFY